MVIEPVATTTEQINCQSSSAATTVARPTRVLFVCAKRHPATPIRKLRLAPSSSGSTLSTRNSLATANSGATTRSWRCVAKKPQASVPAAGEDAKGSPVSVCAGRKELARLWTGLSVHGTSPGNRDGCWEKAETFRWLTSGTTTNQNQKVNDFWSEWQDLNLRPQRKPAAASLCISGFRDLRFSFTLFFGGYLGVAPYPI